MNFYFWILVVGVTVMGLSDGASVKCRRGTRNVKCSDGPQKEEYATEIHLWCNNIEITSPEIQSLNNVSITMKSQELKCGMKKGRAQDQKCDIYNCQIENPLYISALLCALPGLSDGASVKCRRGTRNVKCSDGPQKEEYATEIHLWCNNIEITCPEIQSLNNVSITMKSQELKCGMKKGRAQDQKCDIYNCQIENPLYISALLCALPGNENSGSSSEENDVDESTENNNVGDGDHKDIAITVANGDDEDHKDITITAAEYDAIDHKKLSIIHILLPCLALLLILVVCSFLLWLANRKHQRNLEVGGASDQQVELEEKMGSISANDLRNNEQVYNGPSHVYQEIPATQEDPAEVLKNPLYIPSGPLSQGEHPAEGQYSLLQLPTQLQPPDQQ
ncbi:uncharacterized protein [Aquarana catesbeiana]|uniref:uncharacterized protein n=1 Tax=Aquarana catesbeiana TaxID=8400 RepID=UPI003CC99B71